MNIRDSTVAERQRRYRARRKAGIVVVSVELTERHFDGLIRQGFLAEEHAADPKSYSKAVAAALERLAEN